MEDNRLTAVAEKVLAGCKAEIYFNLKFLWLAMNRLKWEAVAESEDFSPRTDGNAAFFSDRWLAKKYVSDYKLINRTLVHILFHCIFRECERGKGEMFPDLWDLACDVHAEYLIDDFRLPFLSDGKENARKAVYDRLKSQTPVFTTEHIYALLAAGEKADARLFFRDEHSLWPREQDGFSAKKNAEPDEKEESWEEIAARTLADMEFFNQKSGAEALSRQLRVGTRKKTSYAQFLRKLLSLRETVKEDPEQFDYVFYTYGLRLYGNMPLIENLEYRETQSIGELVIVIDTSGSTYENLAETFLKKTYEIVTESGEGRFTLRILQCDDAVRSDEVIRTKEEFERVMKDFKLVGGGGTDFRPAFSYIDELQKKNEITRLKGVLYFTDGKGVYPKTVRPYDVAFVFADENYEDRDVPAWAMKLYIGDAELKEL